MWNISWHAELENCTPLTVGSDLGSRSHHKEKILKTKDAPGLPWPTSAKSEWPSPGTFVFKCNYNHSFTMAELEHPLIRATHESLLQISRNAQKMVVKEMGDISKSIVLKQAVELDSDQPRGKLQPITLQLTKKVMQVKRKMESAAAASDKCIKRCRSRIQHLVDVDQESLNGDQGFKQNASDFHAVPPVTGDSDERSCRLVMKKYDAKVTKLRLDRCLVDFLLRNSFHRSALKLAQQADIEQLVDLETFAGAQKVIQGLKSRDCSKALIWCGANRAKLNRIGSTLEFNLRIQEFIEIIRQPAGTGSSTLSNQSSSELATNSTTSLTRTFLASALSSDGWRIPVSVANLKQAIVYARAYLAPYAKKHEKEIQQAMACLAFNREDFQNTSSPDEEGSYRTLFDKQRWTDLERVLYPKDRRVFSLLITDNIRDRKLYILANDSEKLNQTICSHPDKMINLQEFRCQHLVLNGLTKDAPLNIILKAGLSALKTPWCGIDDAGELCNSDCPSCCAPMSRLAKSLPVSQRQLSQIRCRLSGSIMDDKNPPLALPNGSVYSKAALFEMATRNAGRIICPQTNESYNLEDCRSVFVI